MRKVFAGVVADIVADARRADDAPHCEERRAVVTLMARFDAMRHIGYGDP